MTRITLPALPKDAAHATVRRWLCSSGAAVEQGQALVELEVEDAFVQLEAGAAGVLTEILAAAGQTVRPGADLGHLSPAGTGTAPTTGPSSTAPAPAPKTMPASVTPLLMPQAGNSMEEGTILKWRVKPGDAIEVGQIICDIETDKAVIEHESPAAGRLSRIVAEADQTVEVKQPIAYLGDDDAEVDACLAGPDPAAAASTAPPTAAVAANDLPQDITPILMPQAGNSMEEGTIVEWRVKAGDTVELGQIICDIETDKAVIEYESPAAGRLARIVAQADQTVEVKQPIAYLGDDDAGLDAFLASAAGAAPAAVAAAEVSAPSRVAAATAAPTVVAAPTVAGGRVKASPAARALARAKQLDLATVSHGSGPGGRILSTDLAGIEPGSTATTAAGDAVRRPMSRMRRAIAANLQASKQTVPHFYVRQTISAGPMMAFYRENKPTAGCTVNDVILLAVARTMAEFPGFRSRLDGKDILEHPAANIGIAVGIEDGLVVPVLPAVDRMTLAEVAKASRALVDRARGGMVDNMGQGAFTISNMGMFGVEEFTAIINPPESGILAVSAIRDQPIVEDGELRAGQVMTMTLSADHRIVDGVLAAQFIRRLQEILENPGQLKD
ncbi:MAG: 2-oxo acid dehydrogenase subunit E2 [Phycisphaerae bacterium]|nr:2-oxo acid dehydrogenase subunit E2 [Phycisphaerae bacterium]